ncbi:MAG: glycosyltransferase [Chitinophagaceae bacterium]|nr:glycosyltransferase [Chitinophagaceae bacterium]
MTNNTSLTEPAIATGGVKTNGMAPRGGKKKKIGLIGVGSINWLGGLQYVTNIVHALESIGSEQDIEVHILKNERQHFPHLDHFKNIKLYLHDIDSYFPPWSFTNRVVWFFQRKFFKRIVPRMENKLIKEKFDFVFPIIVSSCNGQLNTAGWIADFQYHYYPEGASPEVTASAYREISFISHNCKKIVLSSKACEDDCHSIFPVTRGKTHAMPFTVYIGQELLHKNNFDELLKKYQLPENFIIVSNLFCPTKNHVTLFKAIALLKDKGIRIDLACTGNIVDQRNLHFGNEILQSITNLGVRDRVHLLGIIPRQDQVTLYRMSKAIVQPSVNEGWSTLVEEAKVLGKNLLLSNIAVHLEQNPGNPYFFESTNVSDLADKIEKLLNDTRGVRFPEMDKEKQAFEAYQKKIQEFGRRFMEVAASA